METSKVFFKTDNGLVNRGHDIEVMSFSWGNQNSAVLGGSRSVGSHPQRPGPDVTDISLTMRMDNNSPVLQQAAASGRSLGNVTVSFRKQIGRGWAPYLVVKLKDVFVSSFTTSGFSGPGPTVAITLSFSSLTFS